ncbi:MAG: hypothetical protein KBE65_21375 [Phycisphaerae bacterium]|nr:hypothetical protein [Phycisphaerae bacterium]
MKQTRQITIKNKVFSISDLQRVGRIFKKQRDLACRSDHHAETSYQIDLSDNTSLDSDSLDLLDSDFINGPARPTQISFTFHNYKLHRRIDFRISHGESRYGNSALVSGTEQGWVSENFLALKEAIDSVPPQSFWFRKHPSILLHLVALGIGSISQCALDLFYTQLFMRAGIDRLLPTLAPTSPWRDFARAIAPFLYFLLWIWRWALGLAWGAFGIRSWLLSLWPNIEFNFGAEHLNIEKKQRTRLILVITLVVIPISTSIVYDLMR